MKQESDKRAEESEARRMSFNKLKEFVIRTQLKIEQMLGGQDSDDGLRIDPKVARHVNVQVSKLVSDGDALQREDEELRECFKID